MKSAQKPWTGRKSLRLYFWADVPAMFINPLPPSKATRLPMKNRLSSISPKYLLPCSREKLTIFIAVNLTGLPPSQGREIVARIQLMLMSGWPRYAEAPYTDVSVRPHSYRRRDGCSAQYKTASACASQHHSDRRRRPGI